MSLEAELKGLEVDLANFKKAVEAAEKAGVKFEGELKGKVPIEFIVDGVIKDYKDAVKKAGSLTSMKPSVVKALDDANTKPTKAAVKQAQKLLADQVKEVQKENAEEAKKNKEVDKDLKKFVDAVGKLESRLEKQDTID